MHHESHHVRFYILATILGVGIHLALHHVTESGHVGADIGLLVFIAYVVHAINFFHAKVIIGQNPEYQRNLGYNPQLFVTEFILIALLFTAIAAMGALIGEPPAFISAGLVVRGLDTALILMTMSLLPDHESRKASRYWIVCNFACALLLGALLYADVSDATLQTWFVVAITADVGLDYWINRRMFFPAMHSWPVLAPFWDAVQGADGDVYRRYLISPHVKSLLDRYVAQGGRILDAGTGNGCLARVMAESGYRVVGIDCSPEMIELAQRRHVLSDPAWNPKAPDAPVRYVQFDLLSNANDALGKFDAAVACFALQDAKELDAPFRTLQHVLADNAILIVIFENDNAFHYSRTERAIVVNNKRKNRKRSHASPSLLYLKYLIEWHSGLLFPGGARPNAPHPLRSTRRRWLRKLRSDASALGDGREAVLYWGRAFALRAQADRPQQAARAADLLESGAAILTTTKHWTAADYCRHARAWGFTRIHDAAYVKLDKRAWAKDISNAPESVLAELLGLYNLGPRFSRLVFVRRPAHA